jgi:hypothetical protein
MRLGHENGAREEGNKNIWGELFDGIGTVSADKGRFRVLLFQITCLTSPEIALWRRTDHQEGGLKPLKPALKSRKEIRMIAQMTDGETERKRWTSGTGEIGEDCAAGGGNSTRE